MTKDTNFNVGNNLFHGKAKTRTFSESVTFDSVNLQVILRLEIFCYKYHEMSFVGKFFHILDVKRLSIRWHWNEEIRLKIWCNIFFKWHLSRSRHRTTNFPNSEYFVCLLFYWFFCETHFFWGTFREGYRWRCWLLVLLLIKQKIR